MRIGLIGAGAVAPFHARAAELLPDVDLTAVCDLDRSSAGAVAEPVGAAVFTDYRDLLDSEAVDAIIVNTPHFLHREMAVAAIERGLHVLVEKPMATQLRDCDTMAEAATRANVVLRVGHIQHFLPDKRAVAEAVAQGSIGKVQLVHDFRTTDYRPGTRAPWFLDRTLAGGGALMNIGAHCLDRSVWLGGASATSVAANTVNRFGVSVETDATIALSLDNGVRATISVISDPPRRVDEITLVGEEGSLVANPRRGALLRRDGCTEVLHEPSGSDIPDAFLAQLADFVSVVGGAPGAVSVAHSRHVVELVLASYDSGATGGRSVDLTAALDGQAVAR